MLERRTLAAIGYVALAVADTVLAGSPTKSASRLRFLTKPLLMPTLATAFSASTSTSPARLTRGTLAAQAFSWGGDVALLGHGDRSFLAGLGSFFAAHLSYIAAFTSQRRRPSDGPSERRAHEHLPAETIEFSRIGLKTAIGLGTVIAPLIASAAGRKDPSLRIPVAAYGTILSAMFASATVLDPALPAGARRTILTGTILFLVSDTTLGAREFLLSEPSPRLEQAVMATYTAAQACIAAGVAQASQQGCYNHSCAE